MIVDGYIIYLIRCFSAIYFFSSVISYLQLCVFCCKTHPSLVTGLQGKKTVSILKRTLDLAVGFQGRDCITIAMKADRYLFIAQYQLILKLLGICSLQAPVRCFVRCHT
jgi:hypothetical protein